MTVSYAALAAAEDEIGVWEWAGDEHNPRVLKYYAMAGHGEIRNDEVPWCAAFVGAMLAKVGVAGTGSLLARSYQSWGRAVAEQEAMPGDVIVLSRGEPWQGHVGFFVNYEGDQVKILGGNQGNQVNIKPYARSRIVAVRRSTEKRESLSSSTTIQAVAATAVSGAAGVGTAVSALDSTAQIVVSVAAGVALLGLIWIARERIRKWAGGDR